MLKLFRSLFLCALLPFFCINADSAHAMKIGVLPASDALALHVAKDEGLFAGQGVEVELVPFQSALEQSAAVRAGALDGWFSDIIAILLMHESGVPQSIIATTSYSGKDARFFGIAVPPGSTATSMQDLKGASVAISQSTIIAYMLDNMLKAAGLEPDHMKRVDIKQISVRLQLLMAGKTDAAVLPEPLLSLMEARGARVVLDNTALSEPLAIVALRKDAVRDEEVAAFRLALAEAMDRINKEPEKYRQAMLEKKLLPEDAKQRYTMLRYPPERCPLPPPGVDDVRRVAEWMAQNKLLRRMPEAGDVLYDNGRE